MSVVACGICKTEDGKILVRKNKIRLYLCKLCYEVWQKMNGAGL